MADIQIAAQLYTLHRQCTTPEGLASSLEKVAKIGYRAVQVSGICQMETPRLKKLLDDNGLVCCATHTGFERMQNEPDKVIEEHYALECKHTAIPSLPDKYRNGEGWGKFAKDASEVAEKLGKGGLKVSYHNHSFEFEKFNGRTGLAIIRDDANPNYLNMEIDTYWVQHGGGDPAQWIDGCKGRIPLIHLKDMANRGGQPIFAEVGEGNLNWPRILESCKMAGVRWYIVEQDSCERDPFESLAISLRNLQSWGLK